MKKYELGQILAKRADDCHKGDFGRVLLLGGSAGMAGAICLAGQAALLAGSGLVTVGVPRGVQAHVASQTTALMTWGLTCTKGQEFSQFAFEALKDKIDSFSAFAFGPGVGTNPSSGKLLRRLLASTNIPVVIDADGLNLLAGDLSILADRKAGSSILTPHLGEFSRLTGLDIASIKASRQDIAMQFARDNNCILLLKGPDTLVTDGKSLYINDTGNPSLATGGSGDILTGIITSLLGQGLYGIKAAAAGAYLHGLSADIAINEEKTLFSANKLLKYIPKAVEDQKMGV